MKANDQTIIRNKDINSDKDKIIEPTEKEV